MWDFVTFLVLAMVCVQQAWTTQSNCVDLSDGSGNITETYPGPRSYRYHKCWNIVNPRNNLLEIELKHLDFEKRHCNYVYLTITVNRTGERIKWCESRDERKPLRVYSNVTVYFYVDSSELTPNSRKNFELHYNIDYSIKGIEGVKEAYSQAVSWLKSNSTSWKWINHIPKAVTALALSGGSAFDGKNLKEELMVKQRELRISVALLRDSISSEQLSTFINSLLSTCHNPRNFYGHNLVELLQKQMASENFTHPASYLALCNANETWPDKAYDNLLKTFKSGSGMPFNRDIQAFAVMALTCKLKRSSNHSPNEEELIDNYEQNLREFRQLQNPSGSFGNVQRTALITQALLSSFTTQELSENDTWDLEKAIGFLVKSMKVPPTDFLSTYLILPLLNGSTLVDTGFRNCSASRDQDDLVDEVHDYLGPKIQVKYSLFIGDAKDVIHTIVLKVPKHFTAFDVMQFAALKDKKYKFKYELVSGALDIYEMADIPNDPEDGKFWLFYVKEAGPDNVFTRVSDETGPAKKFLHEGDHMAMWYKKYPLYI